MSVSYLRGVGTVLGGGLCCAGIGFSGLMSYRITEIAHKNFYKYGEEKLKSLDVSRFYFKPVDKSYLINLVASVAIGTLAVILGISCLALAARCIVPVSWVFKSVGLGILGGGCSGSIGRGFERIEAIDQDERNKRYGNTRYVDPLNGTSFQTT